MGKLLYISYLAYGHFNIGITLGNHLLDLYGDQHEIYFVVDELWYKRLQPTNPRFKYKILKSCVKSECCELKNGKETEEIPIRNASKPKTLVTNDPIIELAHFVGSLGQMSPADKSIRTLSLFLRICQDFRALEPEFDQIIDEVQPNLILTDRLCVMPFVCRRDIPWVQVLSANPLMFEFEKLPPFRSGLGMNEQDKWVEHRQKESVATYELWSFWNDWLLEKNCRPLDPNRFMYESPYFNIYCYPKELDYFEQGGVQLPGRWYQLESAVAPTAKFNKLKLPKEFEQLPGRLIYFSMGSLFGAYSPMMQRLLNIFERLPHKFIISKGCLGNELRMPFNCWGENFVDQKSVLNSGVDLMISHGGNNSVVESFHFGVPLIILPAWGDQYDNGIRLEETELGRCLDAHECTKEQLEEAIDSILNNEELVRRWKRASYRIQKDNGIEAVTKEMLRYLNKSG